MALFFLLFQIECIAYTLVDVLSCCSAEETWKISPILPILAGVQCIFVVTVLCRTACGDPGILPRASPAEAEALDRQLGELVTCY